MKLQLDRQDGPNAPMQDGWKVLEVADPPFIVAGDTLSLAESPAKAEHFTVHARRHVIEPDGSYRLCLLVVPMIAGAQIVRADEKTMRIIDAAKGGAAASALIGVGGKR